jgi:excinuclease ABC subunit C
MQGEATIASCVVFHRGAPAKMFYRRFNIKDVKHGDDYAALNQAVTRHYLRLKSLGKAMPDVLFIDGGKGQLHQVMLALEELQLTDIKVVAIAKGEGRKPGLERLFIAGRDLPLSLPTDSPALHLIQQIRDEAHRFAISAHRKKRGKTRVTSVLQTIPGIGEQRRRALLHHFGGLQEIHKASAQELAKVPGISPALAEQIYTFLREKNG